MISYKGWSLGAAETRAEIDARLEAEAILFRRWWDEGLEIPEIAERSGLSAGSVRNRLARAGISQYDRAARSYARQGRLPNGAWPACRGCGCVFDAPMPNREFCGSACATAFDAEQRRSRAKPKPPRSAEEIAAHRDKYRRKFYAECRDIMRWVFAGRPRPGKAGIEGEAAP